MVVSGDECSTRGMGVGGGRSCRTTGDDGLQYHMERIVVAPLRKAIHSPNEEGYSLHHCKRKAIQITTEEGYTYCTVAPLRKAMPSTTEDDCLIAPLRKAACSPTEEGCSQHH
jgi:hypothetical protein